MGNCCLALDLQKFIGLTLAFFFATKCAGLETDETPATLRTFSRVESKSCAVANQDIVDGTHSRAPRENDKHSAEATARPWG